VIKVGVGRRVAVRVTLESDKAHRELNFSFDNKPCKSVRLYTPAKSIVWNPKDNIWACTPIDIAQSWRGAPPKLQLDEQTSSEANGEPVVGILAKRGTVSAIDNLRLANLVAFVGKELKTDRRLHHLALLSRPDLRLRSPSRRWYRTYRRIWSNLSLVDIRIS
jgi:hypothetical protein